MGRLQIRIIFALYALGALVSVAAGSIEFGLAGRIVNPSGIVSSLVALFLAYNMQKGADWARILLGMISGLGFIVSAVVLIFVARLEFFTLLIVVSALFLGWCTYVLLFSSDLKSELADRRRQRDAEDAKDLARLEAEELRQKDE